MMMFLHLYCILQFFLFSVYNERLLSLCIFLCLKLSGRAVIVLIFCIWMHIHNLRIVHSRSSRLAIEPAEISAKSLNTTFSKVLFLHVTRLIFALHVFRHERFWHKHNDTRCSVVNQFAKTLQHRHTSDLRGSVTTADTDNLNCCNEKHAHNSHVPAYSHRQVDQSMCSLPANQCRLLQPNRCHHLHSSWWKFVYACCTFDHVCKTQRNSVKHRGTTIRTHTQQTTTEWVRFEHFLIFNWHVVAEQKHVQIAFQCFQCFGGGVRARNRNQRLLFYDLEHHKQKM